MTPGPEHIPLQEDVFRLLRDLVSDYCGIFFDNDSRFLLERRLARRLELRGIKNFRDYYRFLLYDKKRDEELSSIIDVLTVNETYFFREEKQFKAFTDEICPEIRSSKTESKTLRVWSAGCASGEEPYTLAMLFEDNPRIAEGLQVEIVGSDINQRVLQSARKGVYKKNSFRSIDPMHMERHFHKEDDGFRIRDTLKRRVSFSYLNLLDTQKAKLVGKMDVIFCRNVLIYFHQDAKKKVIDMFYHSLNDGGYLMLGHAESLMNVSTAFSLKHLRNDMVYQKPRRPVVSMSDESLFRMVWGR